MRKHPVHGRDVILKTEQEVGVRDDLTLAIAKDIVYTHHEKWDGSGYPQGLRGNDIPIAGRLMALVDVYDAAHSRRVYQGADAARRRRIHDRQRQRNTFRPGGSRCVRERRASPATPVRASRRAIGFRRVRLEQDTPEVRLKPDTTYEIARLPETRGDYARPSRRTRSGMTRKYPGAFMMLPGITNTSRSASAVQNRSGSPSGHLDHK